MSMAVTVHEVDQDRTDNVPLKVTHISQRLTRPNEIPLAMTIETIESKVYEPVGLCIYCGATENLGKEHIVPLALGGTLVLPRASCTSCSRITGEFEGKVLRERDVASVRRFRGLPSRSQHAASPDTTKVSITRDAAEEVIEFDVGSGPNFMHFPRLEPPGYLGLTSYERGINVIGLDTISFGPNPKEVIKALGGTAVSGSGTMHPGTFARMIAKIAYAYVAAEDLLGHLHGRPLLLTAILGQSDDIGRWV